MQYIIGVDEAGRGAWAGPFVASAVYLKTDIAGLNDSKKLSSKARKILLNDIANENNATSVIFVTPAEIDSHGLTWAQEQAMGRAVKEVLNKLSPGVNDTVEVILDGNVNYLKQYKNTRAVVKADGKFPCVMAASILAKEARDAFMFKLAKQYPNYGFEKHVGYGTLAHRQALQKYGTTIEHRLSFKPIKNFKIL